MSDYREESEKAKQVKRGVIEQREKIPSTGKDGPKVWILECVMGSLIFNFTHIKKYDKLTKVQRAAESLSKQKYYTRIRYWHKDQPDIITEVKNASSTS